MCGGVEYVYNTWQALAPVVRQSFYSQNNAYLPVLGELGTRICQWGIREWDQNAFSGPMVGSIEHKMIDSLYLRMYQPRKVLIPALQFSEKETARNAVWTDVPPDAFILGLEVQLGGFSVVYVVTASTPSLKHGSAPVIVNQAFECISAESSSTLG